MGNNRMSAEVQLALINNIVPTITALISLVGAIGAVLAYRQSGTNTREIKATNANLNDNTVKTEEVGKAVNGRMSAFIEEMKVSNEKALVEAVKAAVAIAEKEALAHITSLKVELAKAQTEKEVTAERNVRASDKLASSPVEVVVTNNKDNPVPVKNKE